PHHHHRAGPADRGWYARPADQDRWPICNPLSAPGRAAAIVTPPLAGAGSSGAGTLMRSAKNIVAFPKQREERRKDELAFLPAALEIVETPPSPIGRAIAFTIAVAFGVAVVWAWIGTVDIVAVAPGKIIPSGRTKTIQPFETGVVRGIHVRDGQKV